MSTAQKITDYESWLATQTPTTYYEWHNFVYKIEKEVVYFRMLGTWDWYKSGVTPTDVRLSKAMKRIL